MFTGAVAEDAADSDPADPAAEAEAAPAVAPKLAADITPFVPLPPEKQRNLLTSVMKTKGFRRILQILEKFVNEIKDY